LFSFFFSKVEIIKSNQIKTNLPPDEPMRPSCPASPVPVEPVLAPVLPYQRKRRLPQGDADAQEAANTAMPTVPTALPLLKEEKSQHTTSTSTSTEETSRDKPKKRRVVKTKLFGRTHWVVKEEREETDGAQQRQGEVLASIQQKLATGGKVSRSQKKALARDPAILAKLPTPTFVATRVGRGVKPDEARRSQELHSRKLLGTQYSQATGTRVQPNDSPAASRRNWK